MSKKQSDKHLKSESQQKLACRLLKAGKAWGKMDSCKRTTVAVYSNLDKNYHDIIAVFDLRDCYLLRKPLKGIKKTFRKIVKG